MTAVWRIIVVEKQQWIEIIQIWAINRNNERIFLSIFAL